MSFDIRRCSKADLDELNERAKLWRQRTSPAKEDVPAVALAELVVAHRGGSYGSSLRKSCGGQAAQPFWRGNRWIKMRPRMTLNNMSKENESKPMSNDEDAEAQEQALMQARDNPNVIAAYVAYQKVFRAELAAIRGIPVSKVFNWEIQEHEPWLDDRDVLDDRARAEIIGEAEVPYERHSSI